MDVKVYYQKLKETERGITAKEVIVVSTKTEDGGVAGCMSEVPRRTAARLIVENRARLANDQEAAEYRGRMLEAKRRADEEYEAQRIALSVLGRPPARYGKK